MTQSSMMSNQTRRWLVPTVLGALTLVLDQVSKAWIVRTIGPEPLSGAIPLVGDWARLIYTRNTGVAFSLFRNAPQLFTPLALLICAGAIYMYATQLPNRHPLIQVSLGLVLGGALGNVVDRVRLGYVVDFVQVGWWPVFNLADSAICVGVALLMLALVLTERRQLEAQRA